MLDGRGRNLVQCAPHTQVLLPSGGVYPAADFGGVATARLVAFALQAICGEGLEPVTAVAGGACFRGGQAVVFGGAEFLAGSSVEFGVGDSITGQGAGVGFVCATKVFVCTDGLGGGGDEGFHGGGGSGRDSGCGRGFRCG